MKNPTFPDENIDMSEVFFNTILAVSQNISQRADKSLDHNTRPFEVFQFLEIDYCGGIDNESKRL